ncbi:MAG: PAS domain S-box protein [Planctomycetia bacterium]|nr:PAS domain S-box protein [Planctomycetia bacterium]
MALCRPLLAFAIVLAGVGLAAWGFAAYLRSHPAATGAEVVAVAGGLGLIAALLGALAVRQVGKARLRDLGERLSRMQRDPTALDVHSLPGSIRTLGHQIDEFAAFQRETVERQKRTIEILQKEQQLAEITLQSMMGRADSEEGQSHSLVQRRAAGDSALGGPAREMIGRLTPTFGWLAATPALQKFLGCTIVELNNRSIFDLVHREDEPAVRAAFEKALRQGEAHSIEFRLQLRSGGERHVQIDVLTRYTPDGKPLHLRCHFQDVTERVRSNRELRSRTEQLAQANDRLQRINRDLERLKESYRDLYHNAPVLYFSLDVSGRFASCNETMLKALGYTREDLHEQPYVHVLTELSRKDYIKRPDAFQRSGEVEAQWVKKDGTAIDVWIRTTPVLDADGRFLRSRSAAQEVTERNRLADALRAQAEELQETNERLQRINRELDDFTYVVSHDLKEPLRTLQAFSNFLAEDYADKLGAEGKEFIEHLIQASKRLGVLIDDLLTLSRAGRVLNTQQTFDLGEIVNTVRSDLVSLIQRKNAQLILDGSLPVAAGDPQRIAQLLTNLISNGLKYNTSAHPEVHIGWRKPLPTDAGPGHAPSGGRASQYNGDAPRPGDETGKVEIYVRDNGIGIDPRYHEQIFGIFRRLHLPEEYEGTGAGLAICKKIVEAHGGRIWVESQPGQGATFCFTLPQSPPPAGTSRPVMRRRSTMVHADSQS